MGLKLTADRQATHWATPTLKKVLYTYSSKIYHTAVALMPKSYCVDTILNVQMIRWRSLHNTADNTS